MILKNLSQNKAISSNVKIAKSFHQRFMGLMGRKSMQEDEVLVFYKANSIHMFFMRFPIDVVFLDKKMQVIKVVKSIKPWYITSCFGAFCTIEMLANSAEKHLCLGDQLEIIK